ncbi:cytochrome c [uncultured Caulobacter sp.]|uniref:c-type cytochrome n=1 Tax=uncultured Caulobacter sp. TaxID=158749 RepID=UPI00345DCCC9
MTRRTIVGGLVAAALLVAGSATAAPDPVARGREIVTRKCGVCHAVGPTGDSPNPAAPRFRRLNERYDVEDLAEGLAEGLTVGHGPMPEWVFPPEDVAAIVAYLKSIQERDGPSEKTAAPPKR